MCLISHLSSYPGCRMACRCVRCHKDSPSQLPPWDSKAGNGFRQRPLSIPDHLRNRQDNQQTGCRKHFAEMHPPAISKRMRQGMRMPWHKGLLYDSSSRIYLATAKLQNFLKQNRRLLTIYGLFFNDNMIGGCPYQKKNVPLRRLLTKSVPDRESRGVRFLKKGFF